MDMIMTKRRTRRYHMSNTYAMIAIAIMAAVTILIRFIPFIIFSGNRKTPAFIAYLGKVLPYSIMGMLVVYCLKGTSFQSLQGFIPAVVASLVVVLSYVWKRNTLISIISGTVVYMILIQNIANFI